MSEPSSKNQTRHRNAFKAGVNKAAAAIIATMKREYPGGIFMGEVENLICSAVAPLLENQAAPAASEKHEAVVPGLSLNARTVLGSVLGMMKTTLQYRMVESVPSPEMQTALDELVSAGIVIRETGKDDQPVGAVRYSVKEGFDVSEFRAEAFNRLADGTAPIIRVFIKKGDDE